MLAAEEPLAGSGGGKAKSVIVLYLLGGAPSQDMYDMKPAAPPEVRGEFNPIATNVPGIDICELLPKSAQWMHRSAIVRSVNHKAGCHNPIPSYTGYEQPVANLVETSDSFPPSMGSVCEFLRQQARAVSEAPAYVYMPCYLGWGQSMRRPGPYAGFLGQHCDPLYTECNPYVDEGSPPELPGQASPVRGKPLIPNSSLDESMTIDRLNQRRKLVEQLDAERFRLERLGNLGTWNRHEQRAWNILTGSKVRDAFDLDKEDPALLDRYGRTLFGNSALVACRLVEAGVRFVNVTWDGYWERLKLSYDVWDTHQSNFRLLRSLNLPQLDLTYSALMQDLQDRGLLDETLVVVMSDFGRTPKINTNAGRDHWTFCYSVLFSGAGIKGGTVHGASDAQAAYVKDSPVSTGDVCATIYRCLGIDPAMRVRDLGGRPVEIAQGGNPIQAILA
jgi:hypothetical protein